jgi:hypothetical protein
MAIALLIAIALHGLAGIGALMTPGYFRPVTSSDLTFFSILLIICWILIPLYIKLVRTAFIGGIILLVIVIVAITAAPLYPRWYTFSSPVIDLSDFIGFYLFGLALIYFSYKTYQELR